MPNWMQRDVAFLYDTIKAGGFQLNQNLVTF